MLTASPVSTTTSFESAPLMYGTSGDASLRSFAASEGRIYGVPMDTLRC
jgi:hypothetical protein